MNVKNIKKILILAALVFASTWPLMPIAMAAITNESACADAKGTWKPAADGTNGGTCGTSAPAISAAAASTAVYSQADCATAGGTWEPGGTTPTGTQYAAFCNNPLSLPAPKNVPTATLNDKPLTAADKCDAVDVNGGNCKIIGYLDTVFKTAAGAIGLAVTGNIIWAGIQYSMSQGDPSKASKAKDRIRGAIIALIMYLSLSGFIEWLIPGGVF